MGWKGLFSPVVTAAAERKEGTEIQGMLQQIRADVQLSHRWQQNSILRRRAQHHLQMQEGDDDLDPPAFILTSKTSAVFQMRRSSILGFPSLSKPISSLFLYSRVSLTLLWSVPQLRDLLCTGKGKLGSRSAFTACARSPAQ